MGLGVALTGFLTGFAKEAASQIKSRNEKLQENIDRQIELHKKEVADAIEKRDKEREDMMLRNGRLASMFDDIGLDIAQRAYVIQDDATANRFFKYYEEAKGDTSRMQELKNSVSIKNNVKFDNIKDAVMQTTEIEKLTKPVVVGTKTAFGIPSNIQPEQLKQYEETLPTSIKDRKSKVRLTGGLKSPRERAAPQKAKDVAKDLASEIGNTLQTTMRDNTTFKNKVLVNIEDSFDDTQITLLDEATPELKDLTKAETISAIKNSLNTMGETINIETIRGYKKVLSGLGISPRLLNTFDFANTPKEDVVKVIEQIGENISSVEEAKIAIGAAIEKKKGRKNLSSNDARLDNLTSTNKQTREARMAELISIINDPTTSNDDIGRATLELIELEEKK